jgi:hypothetical protein
MEIEMLWPEFGDIPSEDSALNFFIHAIWNCTYKFVDSGTIVGA